MLSLVLTTFNNTIISLIVYQNLLLLNLLINTMVYSIIAVIFSGYGIVQGNSNGFASWSCNLNGFLNTFCCGMEIYTLMWIALERYFTIVKQKELTYNQIIAILVFGYCWIGIFTRYSFINSSVVCHFGVPLITSPFQIQKPFAHYLMPILVSYLSL